jgi:hypothetical protein
MCHFWRRLRLTVPRRMCWHCAAQDESRWRWPKTVFARRGSIIVPESVMDSRSILDRVQRLCKLCERMTQLGEANSRLFGTA